MNFYHFEILNFVYNHYLCRLETRRDDLPRRKVRKVRTGKGTLLWKAQMGVILYGS